MKKKKPKQRNPYAIAGKKRKAGTINKTKRKKKWSIAEEEKNAS